MSMTRLETGFSVMIDELLSSPRERAAVAGAHLRAVEAHFYDIFRAVEHDLPFADIAALMTRATGLDFSGAGLEAQYQEVAHRKALRAMGAAAVAEPAAPAAAAPRARHLAAGRDVQPPADLLPARLARRAATPRTDLIVDGVTPGPDIISATDNITLAAPQVNIQGTGTANLLTVQDMSNPDGVTVALVGGTSCVNQVLNAALGGAQLGVIGSGGAYPTGFGAWAASGLTLTIAGLGAAVVDGTNLNYVDLRITGTPANPYAVFAFPIVYDGVFDGQTWTASLYGCLPDATSIVNLKSIELEARTNNAMEVTGLPVQQGSVLNRYSASLTLADNGSSPTEWIAVALEFDFSYTDQAVDFTFRLAGPQLELGASASAYGPTSWQTLANKTINLNADSTLTVSSAGGAPLLGLTDGGVLELYGAAGATSLLAPAAGGLGVYSAGGAQILGLSQAGVLSANVLASGAATSPRRLAAMAGQVVNVKDYGAVGDGVSDDYPAIAAAIAYAAGVNGQPNANPCIFFPPSATSYLISKPITLFQAANITFFAYPGTVTIAPVPNSAADPLLINFELSANILVSGLVFDGGGATFPNENPAVQCYKCPAGTGTGVVFESCRLQNIRGIGANMSDCSGSGFRDCSFVNIGNYWKTSLSQNDRCQGVAWSCDAQSQFNFTSGCVFSDIGLDAMSLGGVSHVSITGNVMNLFNNQYNLITNSQTFGAGIYAEDCANLVISGNLIDGAAGNGIDTSGLYRATISGNQVNFCGSAGILVAAAVPSGVADTVFAQQRKRHHRRQAAGAQVVPEVTGVIVTGNSCSCNNQWSATILLGGICLYQAADVAGVTPQGQIASVSFSGNACTDGPAPPVQKYGIYASCQSASNPVNPANCWIDQNNAMAGNKIAPVAGTINGVTVTYSVSRMPMETIASVTPSGFLPVTLAGSSYYTQLYTSP